MLLKYQLPVIHVIDINSYIFQGYLTDIGVIATPEYNLRG